MCSYMEQTCGNSTTVLACMKSEAAGLVCAWFRFCLAYISLSFLSLTDLKAYRKKKTKTQKHFNLWRSMLASVCFTSFSLLLSLHPCPVSPISVATHDPQFFFIKSQCGHSSSPLTSPYVCKGSFRCADAYVPILCRNLSPIRMCFLLYINLCYM